MYLINSLNAQFFYALCRGKLYGIIFISIMVVEFMVL